MSGSSSIDQLELRVLDPRGVEAEAVPLDRIDPRYRPVWENRPPAEARALALYFLPHRSKKSLLVPSRPRLLKWYCPFAPQALFPSGHRYALNVYTGCSHGCLYCYAAGYWPEKHGPKSRFENLLQADLQDLERFGVPAAPVHLSNSTDPFQPFEVRWRHTLRALEGILAHRGRFTTVTILTRNPLMAARPEYLDLLRALAAPSADHPGWHRWRAASWPALVVEVSLPFWREEAARFWDPKAPGVRARLAGLEALAAAGVPLVLRVDPLFPPDLPAEPGWVPPQTMRDWEALVTLARELRVHHVVYSALRLVRPRFGGLPGPVWRLKTHMERLAAPGNLEWRGGSRRLPEETVRRLLFEPFRDLCRSASVPALHCAESLLATP